MGRVSKGRHVPFFFVIEDDLPPQALSHDYLHYGDLTFSTRICE